MIAHETVKSGIDTSNHEVGLVSSLADYDMEASTKPVFVVLEARLAALEERDNQLLEAGWEAHESGGDTRDQEIKDLSEESERVGREISTLQQELEQYTPVKAEAVKQGLLYIEAKIDYDKVAAAVFAGDTYERSDSMGLQYDSTSLQYNTGGIEGALMLLEADTPLSYSQLQKVEHFALDHEERLRAQGLLKDDPESVPTNSIGLPNKGLTEIKVHLEDIADMQLKYKKFDPAVHEKIGQLKRFIDMADFSEQPPTDLNQILVSQSYIAADGKVSAAFSRALMKQLDELPAGNAFPSDTEAYAELVGQLTDLDPLVAVKELRVEGDLESLPFDFTEAELRAYLLGSLPPSAFASLKRLVFRPLTTKEAKLDTTVGFHRWSKELDGTEIVISSTGIRNSYQTVLDHYGDKEDATHRAQEAAREEMLHTIIHEFGHEFHDLLPMAALKRWDELRATDSTNVTDYVKSRYDDYHPHRYMEDFADSMALFVNKPDILDVISPTRFKAMRQIFEDFMPLYKLATKKLQDNKITENRARRSELGISDEEVKSVYLRHEVA